MSARYCGAIVIFCPKSLHTRCMTGEQRLQNPKISKFSFGIIGNGRVAGKRQPQVIPNTTQFARINVVSVVWWRGCSKIHCPTRLENVHCNEMGASEFRFWSFFSQTVCLEQKRMTNLPNTLCPIEGKKGVFCCLSDCSRLGTDQSVWNFEL